LGIIFALTALFVTLQGAFPETISKQTGDLMICALYPIWGIATGKRSRDLGTTFTYGLLVGTFFPCIAIVFLFQPGAKYREEQVQLSNPPPLPPNMDKRM
jgi:hypothetical protein